MRRAALGLISLGLLGGGLVAAPAQAANGKSQDAAGWLVGQLQGGLIVTDGGEWGPITHHGTTLDIVHALHELDVRAKQRGRIIEAMEAEVANYTGAGEEHYAGALGKLVATLQTQQVDVARYGDGDLFDRLRARVQTEAGAQQGRATDTSQWGDYSNTLGQSWVVRALAGADDPLVANATDFLLKQQCAAGFFRESMGAATATEPAVTSCDSDPESTGSVDATALAVLALGEARTAGVRGLGDDIRDAVNWLRSVQQSNGAFVGNGVANANSTGLAAWALSTSRWKGSAGTAATWLAKQQVTKGRAKGTALAGDIGAVAYDRAALKAGKADGVGDLTPWVMATAQSAAALDLLLGRAKLTVKAPAKAKKRSVVDVKVKGLEPGERWTVRRGKKTVATGWANRGGVAKTQVKLSKKSGKVELKAQGSRGNRSGVGVVKVR